MSHEFIAFGPSAIRADHVAHATWNADTVNPQIGTLIVCTSTKGFSLSFDHPDVEKAAKAVGLGTFYDDWATKNKEVQKAKLTAQARIDAKSQAEAATAKAHEEEVAKHEAKILADAEKEAEAALKKAEKPAAHATHK